MSAGEFGRGVEGTPEVECNNPQISPPHLRVGRNYGVSRPDVSRRGFTDRASTRTSGTIRTLRTASPDPPTDDETR